MAVSANLSHWGIGEEKTCSQCAIISDAASAWDFLFHLNDALIFQIMHSSVVPEFDVED